MAKKNCEHHKDDLSAYLDEALSAGQKELLDAHLSTCGDCKTELAGLRGVAAMIGNLPDQELPAGFMPRLNMKRLDAERPSYTPLGWLPQPTRIAAFAATGLLVSAVFFNEVRYRLAPKILPDYAGTAALDESAGRSALEAMSEEEINAARLRLVQENQRAESGWAQPADDASAAPAESSLVTETAELLRRSAGTAAVRGLAATPEPKKEKTVLAQAPGAAVGQSAYTNEELRNFLDAESRRMGIKKIEGASQASPDPWGDVPDRPLTKDEARAVMARVTARLRDSNRDARAANNPVTAIEGATPMLLGSIPASQPVGMAGSALRQKRLVQSSMDVVSVPGSRAAIVKDQAEAFLEEDQVLDKVQGKKVYTESEGRKFAAAQREMADRAAFSSPMPVPLKGMNKEQGLEDTSGIEAMPVRRSWDSQSGGFGTPGGAVLTNPADFADLWTRVGRQDAMPAVDFDKEMVIALFGQRSESAQQVEIASVVKQGGRVLIRHRIVSAAKGKGPSAPFQIVVVEKSDFPFAFVQVP